METDLDRACHVFFAAPIAVTALGGSSGFSGSELARVVAGGMTWCVRRWPARTARDRLAAIHRALGHSRDRGFGGVPRIARTPSGESVLELGGRLFDAQEWVSGEPLSGPVCEGRTPNIVRPVSPSCLAAVAAAIGRFHGSTAGLSPGIGDRAAPLEQILEDVRNHFRESRGRLAMLARERAAGEERERGARWLDLLPRALEGAEALLRRHPEGARSTATLCHGDLWPPHIYFSGDTFAGLVDFESVSFGPAATDLAQLILHFSGWSSRDAVLHAYQAVRPLPRGELSLLLAAAMLDLVSEGCWSLDQLYGDTDAPPQGMQRDAHMMNLRLLLPSLEDLVAEVERSPL